MKVKWDGVNWFIIWFPVEGVRFVFFYQFYRRWPCLLEGRGLMGKNILNYINKSRISKKISLPPNTHTLSLFLFLSPPLSLSTALAMELVGTVCEQSVTHEPLELEWQHRPISKRHKLQGFIDHQSVAAAAARSWIKCFIVFFISLSI